MARFHTLAAARATICPQNRAHAPSFQDAVGRQRRRTIAGPRSATYRRPLHPSGTRLLLNAAARMIRRHRATLHSLEHRDGESPAALGVSVARLDTLIDLANDRSLAKS